MMQLFLAVTSLLYISGHAFRKGIHTERSNDDTEFSYQELRNLNVSCYPSDSCEGDGIADSPLPNVTDRCSCHSECWKYDTCCIDSPYKVKHPIQKCVKSEFHDAYFMVYRCPESTTSDSIWKSQCEGEWNEENDILMVSPVTSLDTNRSYKNYYCFKCHETTTNYLFWNLKVVGDYYAFENTKVRNVIYHQAERTWVADMLSIRVNMNFVFPQDVQIEPISCDRFIDINDCSKIWTNKLVREKCLSYRATVYSGHLLYKNVHCALCNDESLEELTCKQTLRNGVPMAGDAGSHTFFSSFMNVNSAEEKTENKKCADEKCVFNPYLEVCQKVERLDTKISSEICKD